MTEKRSRMELRKINFGNMGQITGLSVNEWQKGFVASNMGSLAAAFVAVSNGFAAQPFGIYYEDEPVGFVMFGYDSLGDTDDPPVAAGSYCLWRFMIDRGHQGRGLGKKAMEVCMEYLGTRPMGPGDKVWLSYEPENAAARELYHRFGFVENGEMCGDEIVAVRNL